MVQSEVADRLAAPPGSRTYGVPSVKAAWFADVRRAGSVSRSVFWPAPNVDSGLVAWTRRDPPAVSVGPRGGLPGRRRGLRPAPQDAALDAEAARRLRRGRRGGARTRRASTPCRAGEALDRRAVRPHRRGAQGGSGDRADDAHRRGGPRRPRSTSPWGSGRAATGRLPRACHRLPGRRALRPGHGPRRRRR